MPSYFPDPWEYIKTAREEASRGNTDIMSDGLDINFRRKPWNPVTALRESMVEPGPLTPGDPDFAVQDYLADAQVPSAYGETVQNEARTQALQALERYGPTMDPATRKKLEAIAQGGEAPRSNPFLNVLNVLDTLGETARLGIADLFADEKAGVEVTGRDYIDAFLGREEAVRERLGADFVGGDGQFLMSGAKLLENLGMGDDPIKNRAGTWNMDIARGALGFLGDVVLDPLTYLSFGTVGLGKRAAMEAAEVGMTRAMREGLEGVARNSVSDLANPAAKEYATRITSRINSRLDEVAAQATQAPDVARGFARNRITNEVLSDERRLLDASEGLKPMLNPRLGDVAGQVPYVPRGTVAEEMMNPILDALVDKQFGTLAKEMPWFMGNDYVRSFAKGGVQIGAPFGRKRFPFMRIPGTETNRLASRLLGRGVAERVFTKMPEGTQKFFRWIGRRTGVEKADYQLAREGDLFHVKGVKNLINIIDGATFPVEALRPLSHALKTVEDASKKVGVETAEAQRLLRAELAGDLRATEGIAPELRSALREAIHGDAERGIDGIRDVFATFHDAANRVGIKVGKEANYVPLVVTRKFGKLLDGLAAEGVEIPLGQGSSDLSNVGMAILARYTHNTGAGALSLAGANPAYSQFAQSNNVTRLYRGAVGSAELADDPNILALMANSGIERMSTDFANDAVAAALEDLVRLKGLNRSKLGAVDEAFHTDMNTVLSAYTESMGEAIKSAALIKELKRYDLIRKPEQRIAVSQTLASVRGKLTETTGQFVESVARGEAGAQQASKLVPTSIGGRSTKIPAAVMAHPAYPKVVKTLEKVYSRADRLTPEISAAISRAEGEYLAMGLPAEIAHSLAIADGDVEFGKALSDLALMGAEEGRVLQTAAMELGASGVMDGAEALKLAAEEARKLRAGVEETITQLEAQLLKKLSISAPASESIDVAAHSINAGGREFPFLQGLAEEFGKSMQRRVGRLEDFVAQAPERALSGATPGQIARQAVDDLADELTVNNVTVGQLVEFTGPATAARVLIEINDRLVGMGYRGVESLTDEVLEAVQATVAAEKAAAEALQNVWLQRGYSGVMFDEDTLGEALDSPGIGSFLTEDEAEVAKVGIRQAREAQDAAEAANARLVEAAKGLRGSEEQLGDLVEHVADSVDSLNDTVLGSPYWRDVWAVAIQKTGRVPRSLMAPGSLPQKEITRNLKQEMREAADARRGFWHAAASAEEDWRLKQAATGDYLLEETGGGRLQKALRHMLNNDSDALAGFDTEMRQIIGAITDRNGKQLMDPARFTWRDDGRLVYESATPTFATLDEVMPAIRQIVGQPELPDLEQLHIARLTWDDNKAAIEEVSPELATYFRQLDEAGGLPTELEDYEYLRTFADDLGSAARTLEEPPAPALTPDEDQLARQALSRWQYDSFWLRKHVRRILDGEAPPIKNDPRLTRDEAINAVRGRKQADALLKWWTISAETPGGLVRALNKDEVGQWSTLGEGEEFFMDMASSDIGGIFAQQAYKGSSQGWTMQFADSTRAARNPLNQIEAARGGDEWLVSGYFKVDELDEATKTIRVSPTRQHEKLESLLSPRAVQAVDPTAMTKILDEIPRAMRRDKGSGVRSLRLDKLWDENRQGLEEVLEPEEYERLRDLVSMASASRTVKPSRYPQQLRTLTGTMKEAEETFVRDIARMRMEGHTMGGPWIEGVIDEVMAFREAFARLQRQAPGDIEGGLRPGAEELAPLGGEFDDALTEYRRAGKSLLGKIDKTQKNPQLASFLPELPDGADDLGSFAEQMRDEMLNWKPKKVPVGGQGYVNPKLSGLIGELVEGTEMTEGVALMLEHLAAAGTVMASPLGIRLAADSMREIEKWWKSAATVARPTFVPRNLVGGVVNGLLTGTGPAHYAAVRNNVMKFKAAFNDTGLLDDALDAVSPAFRPYMEGLWKSDLLDTTFASSLKRLQGTPELKNLVNPASHENALFRVGAKFMESSEDFLRAATFVRWYDPNNPASWKLAKEMSLAVHFDYNSLTRMESWIKKFVPFFVWSRRNLPLQMRAMVEQPGHITRLLHLQQNVNEVWGDDTFVDEMGFAKSPYLSAFAMDTPFVFDEDTPYWQRLMVDPQLPVNDLEDTLKAFTSGPSGMADHLIRMVSPVYTAPMEFTGNEDYEVAAPTGLREIMMWTDWLRPGEDKVSGDERLVNPNLARIFNTAIPFLAEWTRTAGLVPSGGNQAARAGYNIEDGISFEERIKAAALTLGRAGGATLQTPADASSAGWRAIFDEIEPAIDDLHITGQAIEPDDIEAYIAALLAREGIGQDPRLVEEIIQEAFVPAG